MTKADWRPIADNDYKMPSAYVGFVSRQGLFHFVAPTGDVSLIYNTMEEMEKSAWHHYRSKPSGPAPIIDWNEVPPEATHWVGPSCAPWEIHDRNKPIPKRYYWSDISNKWERINWNNLEGDHDYTVIQRPAPDGYTITQSDFKGWYFEVEENGSLYGSLDYPTEMEAIMAAWKHQRSTPDEQHVEQHPTVTPGTEVLVERGSGRGWIKAWYVGDTRTGEKVLDDNTNTELFFAPRDTVLRKPFEPMDYDEALDRITDKLVIDMSENLAPKYAEAILGMIDYQRLLDGHRKNNH